MCSQQQTKKRTGFNPKNKNYMFTATNIKKTGFKQKKFTAPNMKMNGLRKKRSCNHSNKLEENWYYNKNELSVHSKKKEKA